MSILSDPVKTVPAKASARSNDKIQEASTDIAHEFNSFVSDVERLIKESSHLTGDDLAHAKIKLNQRINAARQYINSINRAAADKAQKVATLTNDYVHEKPWAALGTGAIVSFVLGLLLGHRNDDQPKK